MALSTTQPFTSHGLHNTVCPRQPRRECRGHIPNILVGEDVNWNIPQYYYALSDIADQCWLPSVRSASIRFSQAGGQSAHKARPPNLELALTPLTRLTVKLTPVQFIYSLAVGYSVFYIL